MAEEVATGKPFTLPGLEERQNGPGHKPSSSPSDKLTSIRGLGCVLGGVGDRREEVPEMGTHPLLAEITLEASGPLDLSVLEDAQDGPGQRPSSKPRDRLISMRGGFVLVVLV